MAFFTAMGMQFLLRGFLAFELTDTAAALGYVSASIAVPLLVVSPIGGTVADRVNKRTLLIMTQSVAAAASAVTAFLILTDQIVFWHLLAVSLVTGIVFSFNMPARQALVPQLVPRHKLMNAISLQMGGQNATRILAPAIAGVLIAPLGIGWVYVVTTMLFVVATASEFRLPVHGMVNPRERRPFLDDFVGGFQYILGQRTLALLLALGLVFPLFAFPLQQMLPVFAEDVFHVGAGGLGALSAASGVGGLLGAMVAANLDAVRHKGRLMFVGGLWLGGLFVAFALTPHFLPALLLLAIGNVGGMVFQTTNNTVIQAGLPAAVRGRVMSVMMMSFGLMPLGTVPVTIAADHIGASWAVVGSSVALLVTMVAFYAWSPRLRHLTVDALPQADLSPVEAARLVAEGHLTQAEADQQSGQVSAPAPAGPADPPATP